MDGASLLFRLPLELRQQIYTYLFFPPQADLSPLRSDFLQADPRFKRCIRLFIEGSRVLVNRNWLNDRHPENVPNYLDILATCRRIYRDAREVLYGQTLFIVCTSDKYDRIVRRGRRRYDDDAAADDILAAMVKGGIIPCLSPREISVYNGLLWQHRREAPPSSPSYPIFPGWKAHPPHCYCHEKPLAISLGRISECVLLKHIQHIRIGISIRLPWHLEQVATQLGNLAADLTPHRKTTKIDLQFHDPRRQSEMRYRKAEPVVEEEVWERFMGALDRVGKEEGEWHVMCDGKWWVAALRRERLEMLRDLCKDRGLYPRMNEAHWWARDLIREWEIAWCGDCEFCKSAGEAREEGGVRDKATIEEG